MSKLSSVLSHNNVSSPLSTRMNNQTALNLCKHLSLLKVTEDIMRIKCTDSFNSKSIGIINFKTNHTAILIHQ